MPAIDGTGIGEIKYIVKRSEYVYGNTNRLLKLSEKMKNEAGAELLQKITGFRYDSNGNGEEPWNTYPWKVRCQSVNLLT